LTCKRSNSGTAVTFASLLRTPSDCFTCLNSLPPHLDLPGFGYVPLGLRPVAGLLVHSSTKAIGLGILRFESDYDATIGNRLVVMALFRVSVGSGKVCHSQRRTESDSLRERRNCLVVFIAVHECNASIECILCLSLLGGI